MKNNKKNKIIAKKDDFIIQYATWNDFPKLKKVANSLSKENKKFYHPWMFHLNPSLKVRIGQFFGRASLIPTLGRMIKKLFPYGYSIILKCLSENNEIVGIIAIYNFKQLSGGKFLVTHADMIKEEFQSRGLGKFQRYQMRNVAIKENVGKISAGIHVDNKRSLKNVKKRGWKIVKVKKNADEFNGKKYDVVEIEKDLEN